MFKKLHIFLISNKLITHNSLIHKYRMHNFYAIEVKFPDICKQMGGNLADASGNVPSLETASRILRCESYRTE